MSQVSKFNVKKSKIKIFQMVKNHLKKNITTWHWGIESVQKIKNCNLKDFWTTFCNFEKKG